MRAPVAVLVSVELTGIAALCVQVQDAGATGDPPGDSFRAWVNVQCKVARKNLKEQRRNSLACSLVDQQLTCECFRRLEKLVSGVAPAVWDQPLFVAVTATAHVVVMGEVYDELRQLGSRAGLGPDCLDCWGVLEPSV
jgi:hypothetical protein